MKTEKHIRKLSMACQGFALLALILLPSASRTDEVPIAPGNATLSVSTAAGRQVVLKLDGEQVASVTADGAGLARIDGLAPGAYLMVLGDESHLVLLLSDEINSFWIGANPPIGGIGY